jgi:hypothetical protein
MAEEKDPNAKETASQTRTSSAEDPEALLEKVLQQRPEVLRAVVEEFFQRRMHMTGRGVDAGVPELTDAQKELEEKAKLFRDATSGPSNEQLKDSTKAPPTIRDVYGDDPPEWALKRINK